MNEKVYFTSEISPQGLLKIYSAVSKNVNIYGRIAIKLHSGEPGGNYFIHPQMIEPLVKMLHGTIIDANTPYKGHRSTTDDHLQSMDQHGFLKIAECDIIDSDGEIAIPIENGKRLSENYIGSHLLEYDAIIFLTHFKGHKRAGYGGTLKDISIGLASKMGKIWIHTAGQSKTNINALKEQNYFIEAMADAAKSIQMLNKKMIYITFLNNISVDGDGCSNPKKPELSDKGILACTDPVALDKACLDMIKQDAVLHKKENCDLIKRIQQLNGEYLIHSAKSMGIGNDSYTLTEI